MLTQIFDNQRPKNIPKKMHQTIKKFESRFEPQFREILTYKPLFTAHMSFTCRHRIASRFEPQFRQIFRRGVFMFFFSVQLKICKWIQVVLIQLSIKFQKNKMEDLQSEKLNILLHYISESQYCYMNPHMRYLTLIHKARNKFYISNICCFTQLTNEPKVDT